MKMVNLQQYNTIAELKMDTFAGGPARRGFVCGCRKELHQRILLGIQTPDIMERFLMLLLLLLSFIAVKTIYKWQHGDQCPQNVVAWFIKSSSGQLATPLETPRWNLILVGRTLVRRGFEVLLKILVRFPFQSETVNEWFTVDVPCEARDDNSEEEGRPHLNVINVNKIGRESKIYSKQNNAAFPENLSEGNHKVFFHGTSHEWAQDIINDGINLELGRKCLDFSNGFYLNDKLDEALEWARGKHRNPAVLVYRFSKATLDTFDKLDLTGQEAKKAWQEVVREFRSGNPDRRFLRNNVGKVDYIEGPMATWPSRNRYEEEHPRAIPDSYQLCVRSNTMAEAFDRCLNSVLFVSK